VDDVLVLANGEKAVPAPIEGAVLAHPCVRGAVAFGRGRTQIGLLVEPAETHTFDPADQHALAAFRNEIWDAVEAANRNSPAFARVYKEMILVTSPNKPLPRTGKGTVQKKAALKLYDEEILSLYVLSRFLRLVTRSDTALGTTPLSTRRRDPLFSLLQHGTLKISRCG
jgi:long-subunit acyl-CoA synthetase (AMP-forming)